MVIENKESRFCWRRYKEWLKPFRASVLLLLLLGLIGVVVELILPLAMRFLVDSIVLNQSLRPNEKLILCIWISSIVLLLSIANFFIGLASEFLTLDLNVKLISSIRRLVLSSVLRSPLFALANWKSGEFSQRILNDVEEMSVLLRSSIIVPVVLGTRVVATFLVIFAINWRLALIVSLMIPPMLAVSYYLIRNLQVLHASAMRKRESLMGLMVELFNGIRVLKINNREGQAKLGVVKEMHSIARLNSSATKKQILLGLSWGTLVSLIAFAVISVGSIMNINSTASFGDIFALSLYSAFILGPVSGLVQAGANSKRGIAALRRVCDSLQSDKTEFAREQGGRKCGDIESIEFRNVNFGYDKDRTVLSGINFTVNKGEAVALVGRSGAGKSTLVDLLARFYTPDSGGIFVNGEDTEQYSLREFRSHIGVVEQRVTLFDGTIAENIRFGDPLASEGDMQSAARLAGAHDFIMNLEDDYSTVVGENGKSLSVGQAQRISIARAFVRNAKILIMDEATSNLDDHSEQSIQESLSRLLKNRITFIIAHRLKTVQCADKVIVLEKGKIVEMGSPGELLKLRGMFFESVISQAGIMGVDGVFADEERRR